MVRKYTAKEKANLGKNFMELNEFAKMIGIDTTKSAEQIDAEDELLEVTRSLVILEDAGILTEDDVERHLSAYKERTKCLT